MIFSNSVTFVYRFGRLMGTYVGADHRGVRVQFGPTMASVTR